MLLSDCVGRSMSEFLGLACILNESDFCMLTIHSKVGVVVYVCTCKNNFYLPY